MNATISRILLVSSALLSLTGIAAADRQLRVGLLGGLARSLEESPRQGGVGTLRVRAEHCEDGFVCAVNLSLLGGYGLEGAGGFQQWLTLDLGVRLDPAALYSSIGFGGRLRSVRHGGDSTSPPRPA